MPAIPPSSSRPAASSRPADPAIDPTVDTPRSPVAADSANDNQTAPHFRVERDLEALIMAAAGGDKVAKEVLRPAVHRLALDSLIYLDEARRVTDDVLFALGARTGSPLPGRAVAFLRAVVRTSADRAFEETRREQYEEHDP